jgi:hypothetical protein
LEKELQKFAIFIPHNFVTGLLGTMKKCGDDNIREPFEKFVDSTYYSESLLSGGAVTVSFSKYLPWQAMHFLQRSTHFWKTCCRPLITSIFLASELPFHGWKSPEKSHRARSELNSVFNLDKVDRWNPIRTSAIQSRSRSMRFLGFSDHEKGAPRHKKFRSDQRSAVRFRELGGTL